MNEFAINKLEGNDNVRLISYDRMCEDPLNEVESMFTWCGLDFNPQTTAFIKKSTDSSSSSGRFFSVFKDPLESARKWTTKLSEDQIKRILNITDESIAGEFVNSTSSVY